MTQFAASTEPTEEHSYGVPLPEPTAGLSILSLPPPALEPASLPTTVDLSVGVPPIGNQGHTSSCQSWATGYNAMGWWANKVGLSNAQFAPMFLYSQLVKGDCSKGAWPEDDLELLKTQGIDTRSDYEPMQQQLDCATQPSSAQGSNAARFKITDYSKSSLAGGTQKAIMTALAAGYPAIISFTVYPEFDNANSANYLVGPPQPGDTARGGHAVAAFKYDSNGVWIANQWGSKWGYAGWAILSWDFVNGSFGGRSNVLDVATITGVSLSCTDSDPQCADWAASSQCQENPDYMLANCCASCADPSLACQSYTFSPLSSPTSCLDVSNDLSADYTNIDEWGCNGTPAQSFTVVNAQGGNVNLYHPHSGKCVDAQMGGVVDGTQIDIYDCNGTGSQIFQAAYNDDGSVTWSNPQSGKCLDVWRAAPADGTKIQLHTCNGTDAQKWSPVGK